MFLHARPLLLLNTLNVFPSVGKRLWSTWRFLKEAWRVWGPYLSAAVNSNLGPRLGPSLHLHRETLAPGSSLGASSTAPSPSPALRRASCRSLCPRASREGEVGGKLGASTEHLVGTHSTEPFPAGEEGGPAWECGTGRAALRPLL